MRSRFGLLLVVGLLLAPRPASADDAELRLSAGVGMGVPGFGVGGELLARVRSIVFGGLLESYASVFDPPDLRATGGFVGYRLDDGGALAIDLAASFGAHRYVHDGVPNDPRSGIAPFAGLRVGVAAPLASESPVSFGALLFVDSDLVRRDRIVTRACGHDDQYVCADPVTFGRANAGILLRVGVTLPL